MNAAVSSAVLVAVTLVRVACLAAQTDPRGNWQTWRTPHFRIHARAEHAAVAVTAAGEAERAYAALRTELHPPRGTVDVVLYDNVDFANGYASVLPSNRIVVFLAPPAGEVGLSHYDDWLRLVLTHELTHVFHLDRSRGAWGALQRVFGRAPPLFPNMYRPAWVGEGLATYYETRFTSAGRGDGGFHAQILLGKAADRRWPRPGDNNLATSLWPGGTGPYAFGSRFFDYQWVTHGDSVAPRFVEATSRRLWPLTISGPLKQAGGNGLDADWKGFAGWWNRGSPPAPSRIIARGLRAEPRPRVSPDGKQLAFISSDGRTRERLVVRDLQTGRDVASRAVNSSPEIMWAGQEVVLAELQYTQPVEIRSHLYRWNPQRGDVRKVSHVPRLTRPFALGDDVGAILLGPSATTPVRVQGDGVDSLAMPAGDAWSHVARSPDGAFLAGSRHAAERWDIVLWPAGAPERVVAVTEDDALDDDPMWSTDGREIRFTSERSGVPQIYSYHVDTRRTTQLTDEPTGAREGETGADGMLYFSTVLGDGYAIMSRTPSAIEPRASPRPRSRVALRPAPIDPVRGRYSPWASLAPRFWIPLVHDVGGVGRFFGAGTSGADVVGRTSYLAAAGHAAANPRWEGYFSVSHSQWAAASLDFSAQQFWDIGGRVTAATGATVLIAERDRSLTAGATIRHERWRSSLSLRFAGELTQDALFGEALSFPNPAFGGGAISVEAGTRNRQILSISEESGLRVTGLYRRRWALGSFNGGSDELRGTLRGYLGLPLPGFAKWVLAGRVAAAMSNGQYPRNFAMGGESGSGLGVVAGVGLSGSSRDFSLRGYPRDAARFTRALTSAAELRIPLFLIGKAVWKLPLVVDKVSVTAFGEAGGGWRAETGPRGAARFRDIGAELVLDMGLNLDLPVRVRLGAAQALTPGLGSAKGDWRGYVAVGSAF